MVYITTDIHGRLDRWHKLKRYLDNNGFNQEQDRIYLLGDVIDRGNDSIALLMEIMNDHSVSMIIGNHEYAFISRLNNDPYWDSQITIANQQVKTIFQYKELTSSDRHELSEWLNRLPLYYMLDDGLNETCSLAEAKFVLTHAPINPNSFKENKELSDYTPQDLLESRKIRDRYYTGKQLIFGHIPTCNIIKGKSPSILIGNGYLDIDCGCFMREGALACICIKDNSGTFKTIYVR